MKKNVFFLFVGIITLLFSYCTKDIIATDITKKTVNILAPGNSIHTTNNNITFWWDAIDGADKYELQLVSPSFASVVTTVADTNVTTNKFNLTLSPGTYEWRIRAINNAGSTAFSTRSFTIDSTSNLAGITVPLSSPADSFYTNQKHIVFSWQSVPTTTKYEFKITDITSTAILDTTLTSAYTSRAYTFSQAGIYTWGVSAKNNSSSSSFSTRTVIIDLTPPNPPTNLLPVSSGTLTPTKHLGDTLKWARQTSTGAISDSLFIGSDSLYNSSTTTLIKQNITSSSTLYIIPTAGVFSVGNTYYWRLSSTDKAGNTSSYTTPNRKFTIN